MKIAVISNVSLSFAPYIRFYTDLLDHNNIDYCIINKEDDKSVMTSENHCVFFPGEPNSKVGKICKTIQWYSFIRYSLKEHEISKIIVSPTRTAIILFPLLFFYKSKYILDIRDYTKEYSVFYRFIEKVLIKRSYKTILSSRGFLQWIPYNNNKLLFAHNIRYEFVSDTIEHQNMQKSNRRRIAYVGIVDYYEPNTILIQAFENKNNYELVYSGTISQKCALKEYVQSKKVDNVIFTGPYKDSAKDTLYTNVDMINALYGDVSPVTLTAIPNKLYDAVIHRIPILVSKDTYLEKVVKQYKLGVSVDIHRDNVYEIINNYLDTYNKHEFDENCNRFLNDVKHDQEEIEKQILNFCTER